jgi:hypothetical protein
MSDTIPAIPKYKIDAVEDWIVQHRNVPRPIPITLGLLAIVCELHNRREHFPASRRLAEHMECTPGAIDRAISTATARNEIAVIHHHLGEVKKNASINRRRYLVPERTLLSAYNSR